MKRPSRASDRLLRLPEVFAKIGLSRSAIYDRLDPKSQRYDPSFPKPAQIGARAIAFSERELDAWIAKRKAARVEAPAATVAA